MSGTAKCDQCVHSKVRGVLFGNYSRYVWLYQCCNHLCLLQLCSTLLVPQG